MNNKNIQIKLTDKEIELLKSNNIDISKIKFREKNENGRKIIYGYIMNGVNEVKTGSYFHFFDDSDDLMFKYFYINNRFEGNQFQFNKINNINLSKIENKDNIIYSLDNVENFKISSKSFYKNRKLMETIYYHNNGKKRIYIDYENNLKRGSKTSWDIDGVLEMIERRVNDKLNGLMEFYDNTGKIYKTIDFKDDKENGKEIHYYENGNTKYIKNYKNGKLDGEQIAYYEDGEIHLKDFLINGKYENTQYEYYKSGIISEEENYKNGKLEGLKKEYYENGVVKKYTNYKNGKKLGEMKEYYDNGELKFHKIYENNKSIFNKKYKLGEFKKEQEKIINLKNINQISNKIEQEYNFGY